jgi:hypothetical protein
MDNCRENSIFLISVLLARVDFEDKAFLQGRVALKGMKVCRHTV